MSVYVDVYFSHSYHYVFKVNIQQQYVIPRHGIGYDTMAWDILQWYLMTSWHRFLNYFGFCRQARHGHGKTILSQAAFALQDYTLPTFSVKIDLPDVIRDSRDGQVPIHITVRSGLTSTCV